MKTIHIAPIGHEYETVTPPGKSPVLRARGKIHSGQETLCGLAVPGNEVKVALPFEHPSACKTCVAKFPERPTTSTHAVMW